MKFEARSTKSETTHEYLKFQISKLFRYSNFEFRISRSAGYTLLETIVALALIVGALTGPVTLIATGLTTSKFSKNKLIALNLAQEGLEIIRTYRDNNVLAGAGRNFDTDIGAGVGSKNSYYFDIYNCLTPGCLPLNAGFHSCAMPACPSLLLDPSSGIYSYQATPGSFNSPFTRVIIITRKVASDPDPLSSVNTAAPAADHMRVISTVTWVDSGVSRKVQLEEELYNW